MTEAGMGIGEQTPRVEPKLSDEVMGRLISSVGNHEGKAVTLIAMQKGVLYNSSQLHRRIISFQGEAPGWKTDSRLQFNYCSHTLSPIGLAVKEELQEGSGEYGYRLTEKIENQEELSGEEGQLFACLMLDFSSRYPDTSLIDLFGSTSSKSKKTNEETGNEEKERAPINRWKIFNELITSPQETIKQADLARSTSINQSKLSSHLIELGNKGIIQYSYVEKTKPVSFYSLDPLHPDKPPEKYMHNIALTQAVYEILAANSGRQFTIEDTSKIYTEKFDPDKKLNPKRLRANVSSILSHLKNNGYLTKGVFDRYSRTSITITPERQSMLSDLLNILDKFQNQDPQILQRAEQLLHQFRTNPEIVSSLMRKAQEHSGYANRKPVEETISAIKSIKSENPDATPEEIRKALLERGINLSPNSIRKIRRQLRKSSEA